MIKSMMFKMRQLFLHKDCREPLNINLYFEATDAHKLCSFSIGSLNVKVLPSPNALSTVISPPCSSTIHFTIDNPKPVFPMFEDVRAASTR